MLDVSTKRRIDTARDILVGKVPDPKSQVEQITIALIYKFMDDMDAEAEELGGKRKFFAGDYARYGWAKLMRSGLGGHETLNLYAEAIAKMPENPGIPPLFRDIFKNAYLPYRDPETLRAFLKVIDEFNYDHSERLGDAFEYLLSVLGSQGDAGQFRTPRHIIDFMVEIIDPKKNESILDPACGTAGFLISAYKHILKSGREEIATKGAKHTKSSSAANSPSSPSSHSSPPSSSPSVSSVPFVANSPSPSSPYVANPLTPDEREKLAKNIKGYDISPDMVRLSLVNLYLHGFTDPHIYEYDSLTSQDRWNEYADVILANPPFMSPKGGIKPHNRFSVQSKRSEVLFVDYMAEHLTPKGRAGIIVPEGIIFQSQTAYKDLRKMLVEEFLVAVVSLPAGIFQPYSGVKTSILILDKSRAKNAKTIAFFKVENDGFGLGAQRRAIEKNDLPDAAAFLKEFLQNPVVAPTNPNALIVQKDKIAANGDYNLSGERYREGGARKSEFPLRRFEEVCTLEYGASLPKDKRVNGPYPVVGSNGITGYHKEYLVEGPVIVVGRKGSAGEVTLIEKNCFPIDTTYYVKQTNPAESDISYLYWLLKTLNLPELRGGAGIPGLNRTDVYETHQIPLPHLSVQQEIVAEIEGYQKVINGARAVLDNYRPHIPIHPDWPMVELGKVCIVNPRKSEVADLKDTTVVSFVPMSDIGEHEMYFVPKDTKQLNEVTTSYTYFKDGDVLLAKVTPCFENGKAGIARGLLNGIGFGSSEYYVLRPSEAVLSEWIFMCAATPAFRAWATPQMTGTGGLQRVPRMVVESYSIPLPPLATQQTIVSEIEAEQALVAANRELIIRFEKKIQTTLARVWGEEEGEDSPQKAHKAKNGK